MNLFPRKFSNGFSTHRFVVAAIDQPPFVMKFLSTDLAGNTKIDWDGLEIRLLTMMSNRLNFSYQVIEPEAGTNPLGYLFIFYLSEIHCFEFTTRKTYKMHA